MLCFISQVSTKHLAFYQWMMYHPHESSPDKFSISQELPTNWTNSSCLTGNRLRCTRNIENPTPLFASAPLATVMSNICRTVFWYLLSCSCFSVIHVIHSSMTRTPCKQKRKCMLKVKVKWCHLLKKNMKRIDRYTCPMRPTDDSSWVLLIPLSVPSAFKVKAVAEDVAATSLNDSASCNSG